MWFSRLVSKGATDTDALAQPWAGWSVYAFPPINLIQKTLLKIRSERVEEVIMVCPYWPNRPWFTLLLQMSIAQPIELPVRIDLLTQRLEGKGVLYHPDLRKLRLTGWRLSGAIGAKQA